MTEPTITPVRPVGFEHDLKRGTLGVFQDGQCLGVIVDTGSDWLNGPSPARVEYRVHSAGPGIPTPQGSFATPEDAAGAIVEARRASEAWVTPGLDGLTEFDRRALAFELTPEAQTGDGRRERAIAEQFHGIHPSLYAGQVVRLLTDRHAAAHAANPAAVEALDRRRRRRRPMTRPGDRRRALTPALPGDHTTHRKDPA